MTLTGTLRCRHVAVLALGFGLQALTTCALAKTWTRPPVTQLPGPAPIRAGVIATVFLIGDAGLAETASDPVLAALSAEIGNAGPAPATVVFLGDNVYPVGVPSGAGTDHAEAVRCLLAQADAANQAQAVLFIPGNHDHRSPLDNERAAIDGMNRPHVRLLPCRDCPVETVAISADLSVHLIAIDTEAWLQNPAADAVMQAQLTEALIAHPRAIVVGHHPRATHGPHGGFFGWRVWEYVRRLGFSHQDLSHPRNQEMRRILGDVFTAHRPLLYASGHEHSLQVLQFDDGSVAAVSGAGSIERLSPLRHGSDSLLASPEAGFMRLDLFPTGARLQVIEVLADGTQRRWVIELPAD